MRVRVVQWAVAAVLAALAGASPACLPAVQFESPGADASTDAPTSDSTEPTGDGGVDAQGDAVAEGAPGDSAPDVAPGPPMASSSYGGYGQIAACAVHDGTLYCWGDVGANATGQLGFPDEDAGGEGGLVAPTAVTTTIEPASQIVQLVMGDIHTCALYGTTAYCWGSDRNGQIGNVTDPDGGPTETLVVGAPPSGFTAMAVASISTCALAPTGDAGGGGSNVYCWGDNGTAQLGRPVALAGEATASPVTGDIDGGPLGVIPNAMQIAGGGFHFCVITSTGGILCWGSTEFLESGPTQGPADCPGGDRATCSPEPQSVTLPTSERPVGLALGDYHSCALTQAGNVYCWGSNWTGQLAASSVPDNCPFDMADAGCTGTPVKVAVSGIQHLFAGGSTSCALDAQRHAYCWGNNEDGELAQGADEPTPGVVELLMASSGQAYTFDDMAMGRYSVCARDGDSLYCWGGGVLGAQTDAYAPTPVQF